MKTYQQGLDGPGDPMVSMPGQISLTNSGALQVYCLGTGSMVSSGHGNTSYLIVKGKTHILVDCGPSIPGSLEKFGINLGDIHAVYLTHSHADHIGGFPKVLVHARYMQGTRPKRRMSLMGDPDWLSLLWDTSLVGDLGTHDFANPRDSHAALWYEAIAPQHVSSCQRSQVYHFGDLKIESFRVAHTPANSKGWEDSAWATGLLVDDKVWISGDTRFDPDLVQKYSDKALIFLHDVASGKSPVHASLDELALLPKEIKDKMWLIHYGDEWVRDGLPSDEAIGLVQSHGFVGLAYTGLSFSFQS